MIFNQTTLAHCKSFKSSFSCNYLSIMMWQLYRVDTRLSSTGTELNVKSSKDSIKIIGNPELIINKKILINQYHKDHRVFMTSVIAALTLGGSWTIHDMESHKSSFPSFLSILRKIGYRFTISEDNKK